jgi:hypothetical protein
MTRLASVLTLLAALAHGAYAADVLLVDAHPHRDGRGAWAFCIPLDVAPLGLRFAGVTFAFADVTDGMAVAYNGGEGFSYHETCEAIGPTLYAERLGYATGWTYDDMLSGAFSGVVTATAPLVRVTLYVSADAFERVKTHGACRGWRAR